MCRTSACRWLVKDWVKSREAARRAVLQHVRCYRERKREANHMEHLPDFEIGDYVMTARVRKLVSIPKLVGTWTGPW